MPEYYYSEMYTFVLNKEEVKLLPLPKVQMNRYAGISTLLYVRFYFPIKKSHA